MVGQDGLPDALSQDHRRHTSLRYPLVDYRIPRRFHLHHLPLLPLLLLHRLSLLRRERLHLSCRPAEVRARGVLFVCGGRYHRHHE